MILTSLVAGFLIANPAVAVEFKSIVSPQNVDETRDESTSPVLRTPIQIFISKSTLSLIEDKNFQKQSPPLTGEAISFSNKMTNLNVTVPEVDNTKNSVYIQLGGKNVFGRSAFFFGDLLLTDTFCPDYKDGGNSATCKIKIPSIQLFKKESLTSDITRIRVKIFRNGTLLTKNLTPEIMGDGESRASYLGKYSRSAASQPLSAANEQPKGTLKGFFLYAAYKFEGASNENPQNGDQTFEVQYGLPQAAYRIPVLSRQNPANPFKKEPDSYLIEVEITYSDKAPATLSKVLGVGAEDYLDPSKVGF